jgi:cytochrome c553
MKPNLSRHLPMLALTGALVAPQAQAQADDAVSGRQKAQACAVCHGPLGLSVTPDAPNLAGQPALYLTAQLRAYRSGARKHEVMTVISKPLTDDDIRQLATWFSSLRIDVQRLP